MTRSEALKRYWSIIKEIAHKTGRTTAEVRHEFKGTPFPRTSRTHYVTSPFQYEAHVGKEVHVTVSSDRPLTPTEIRGQAATIFRNHADEYDERVYNEDDIDVGESFIDTTHIPENEEEEEEGARDYTRQKPEYRYY